jgi:hypothetical protein
MTNFLFSSISPKDQKATMHIRNVFVADIMKALNTRMTQTYGTLTEKADSSNTASDHLGVARLEPPSAH